MDPEEGQPTCVRRCGNETVERDRRAIDRDTGLSGLQDMADTVDSYRNDPHCLLEEISTCNASFVKY